MAGHHPWIERVGVVTTSRADYGIYRPLLRRLAGRWGDGLSVYCGGSHLLEEFGKTVDHVRADGFGRLVEVDFQGAGDRGVDVARSAGRAVERFAEAFEAERPHAVSVLGDRSEMLAAGLAAAIMRVPLLHLYGGELTAGSTDDQFRHALTKLSHVHLTSTDEYAARVRQMGEEPWRVTTVGALAIDTLRELRPDPPEQIRREVGLDVGEPFVVVVYHPETTTDTSPGESFERLTRGLAAFDGTILLLGTNADVGQREVVAAADRWCESRRAGRIVRRASLTQQQYFSCLRHAAALVGNSSSGIIESASLRLPVVNVGQRQAGRVRASNVLDVPCEPESVAAAVAQATSARFREALAGLESPYGDGRATERIGAVIDALPGSRALLVKQFQQA